MNVLFRKNVFARIKVKRCRYAASARLLVFENCFSMCVWSNVIIIKKVLGVQFVEEFQEENRSPYFNSDKMAWITHCFGKVKRSKRKGGKGERSHSLERNALPPSLE